MEDDKASPQVLTPHSKPPSDSYPICTSSLTPDPLSGIPVDYHKYHKVFSGAKADTLPPHPMTSKLPWRKGLNCFMAQYTPYHHWSWQPFKNS